MKVLELGVLVSEKALKSRIDSYLSLEVVYLQNLIG